MANNINGLRLDESISFISALEARQKSQPWRPVDGEKKKYENPARSVFTRRI
jgi:hypothetical protein